MEVESFAPNAYDGEVDITVQNETLKNTLVTRQSETTINNILLPPELRVHLPTNNATVPGELLLDSLSNLVKNATDQSTFDCIVKTYGAVRKGIETTGAVTQCLNVINGVNSNRINKNCWICGYPINPSQDLFKPECEHVFPIAQAIAFTGLYSSSLYKSLQYTKQNAYINGLKLEYAWAHKICNRVKNDTHFIKLGSDPPAYKVDPNLIRGFLNQITTTHHFERSPNPLYGIDLSGRVEVIYNRCDNILSVAIPQGVSIDAHVANTLLDLKTFIVNNLNCGLSPPVPNTIPTVAPGTFLSVQTSQYAIQLREFYFNLMIDNYIPGYLNEVITSLPIDTLQLIDVYGKRTSDSRTKSIFSGLWFYYRNNVANEFKKQLLTNPGSLYYDSSISRLRDTILLHHIISSPSYSQEQIWSKYQTWLPGIVFIFVLAEVHLFIGVYISILNQKLVLNNFIIPDNVQTYISQQMIQKLINYENSMTQEVVNTVVGNDLYKFVEYQKLTPEQFEALKQQYSAQRAKSTWFSSAGKRRKSKKRKSKRRKTYRRLRLF